jgi:hypothetical protein
MINQHVGGGYVGNENIGNLSEIQRVLLMMAQDYQQRAEGVNPLSLSTDAAVGITTTDDESIM